MHKWQMCMLHILRIRRLLYFVLVIRLGFLTVVAFEQREIPTVGIKKGT